MTRIRNTLNLLSRLSVRKLANMVRVYASFHWSRLTGKPAHWGMPFALAVEPTTHCNLRCPECPSGLRSFTRPTGQLASGFFKNIIDEVRDHVWYLTFYFQGEPYLHPEFLDMVTYARDKGIYTATSTNAHYLNDERARQTVESGLDRLIISIDGTTQETYEAYRVGGKLDKVLDGTRKLVAWKKKLKSSTPHVIFQFLVVRPNEHQIGEVRSLAREIGVDEIIFKTAQVYDYEHGHPLIPTLDKYARYRQKSDGTWMVKNPLDNQCWKMWHSCVVTWDGRVVPCCFDKDAGHVMGFLGRDRLRDIWQAQAYRDFRTSLLRSRREIDICRNCSEGCRVNFNVEV